MGSKSHELRVILSMRVKGSNRTGSIIKLFLKVKGRGYAGWGGWGKTHKVGKAEERSRISGNGGVRRGGGCREMVEKKTYGPSASRPIDGRAKVRVIWGH